MQTTHARFAVRARALGGDQDADAAGALAPARGVHGAAHRGRPLPQGDALRAALNGVLGDYLERSNNPLAIPLELRHGGAILSLQQARLKAELPQAGARVLVLLHGLCMNDLQWLRAGHDHGAALARDLGFTPVYLRYNSGLHISQNARRLAALLELLLAQ